MAPLKLWNRLKETGMAPAVHYRYAHMGLARPSASVLKSNFQVLRIRLLIDSFSQWHRELIKYVPFLLSEKKPKGMTCLRFLINLIVTNAIVTIYSDHQIKIFSDKYSTFPSSI